MANSMAPVPQTVMRTLEPFGQSFTLPAEAYISEDVFSWEKENFFAGSWVCVGRSLDLPHRGDRKAVKVGAESVLLVRDEGDELRAFFNVCRHRGHELLPTGVCDTARVIRCPYHAWVYGLDGELKGAPHFGDRSGFDRADYPLQTVQVQEWHGWVFVNISGDAPGFAEHVGNLGEFITPYEPERLISAVRHEYVIQSNWKIIVENYHECYHCPQIHPELCRVTPPDSGYNVHPDGAWAGGTMELMDFADTMSLTGESLGVPLRGLDPAQRRQVLYFGYFPNLLLSPHPDYLMTHRIEPLGPDSSLIECEWLFPPEAVERDGFDPSYAAEFWDITNKEDWGACEAVQRGLSSRGSRQGPLAPDEDAVYDFITMVARGYVRQDMMRRPPQREASVAGAMDAKPA
ncbi:MAG: aromatic ring-hydroxylating dioxygenase subunit alpha, partial [Actinomycetota bacterium]|nr:aromatic ring-hydroxylating dioxygenase subunit alpha [Actinomycetota bacterium]